MLLELHFRGLRFRSGVRVVEVRDLTRTVDGREVRGPIRNPIVRLGFRLFGRREQLRFLDVTCERMRRLTEEALRAGSDNDDVRQVAEDVTAHPAPGTGGINDELARNLDADAGI